MTGALALTPADVAYLKGIAPVDIVDGMIADGKFVIVDQVEACENDNRNQKS